MAFDRRTMAGRAACSVARSASSSDSRARLMAASLALPMRFTHSSDCGVSHKQAARPSRGSEARWTRPARVSWVTRVLTELDATPSSMAASWTRMPGRRSTSRSSSPSEWVISRASRTARVRYRSPRPMRARTLASSGDSAASGARSEEHTSELQSQFHLVCRLLLEKKKNKNLNYFNFQTFSFDSPLATDLASITLLLYCQLSRYPHLC